MFFYHKRSLNSKEKVFISIFLETLEKNAGITKISQQKVN